MRWGSAPQKRHETRGWTLGRNDLPVRLAITAGKGDGGLRPSLVGIDDKLVEPYRDAVARLGYTVQDPWAPEQPAPPLAPDMFEPERTPTHLKRLPLGALIGLVTITEILTSAEAIRRYGKGEITAADFELGNYGPDRFAWRMDNALELPQPIPVRGMQGLWPVTADVVDQILRQAPNALAL